ncbi:conserved Plasmodium protein, unknown function [Plasmodium sp. DRC-Itaito]|nr:conserved Plasmodium protein, unknown function [Plasmodium sp. DRC-Itaito]
MYHLNLRVLLYFTYLIQCIFVSSYSTSKSKENGNTLFTNILMNKNRNNDLSELNFSEVYDMKRPKGRNINNSEMNSHNNSNNNMNGGLKMRKNVNKLFNTLYPNEINKEEKEINNTNNVNEKQSYINNTNNINNINNDDNNNNNNSNYDDLLYKNEKDDLYHMNDIDNVKIINDDSQYNKTSSYEEKQKTTFDIVGNNEKMKSESKFAIVNYLKDFFQNSPYVKNFQNTIEVFFNKYDQRILESTVFFNFDETLF